MSTTMVGLQANGVHHLIRTKTDVQKMKKSSSLLNNSSSNSGGGGGSASTSSWFQMPLHYPRYKKSDYETMPEWQLDCLLKQYGLPVVGDIDYKRKFVMGAFLWPTQYE